MKPLPCHARITAHALEPQLSLPRAAACFTEPQLMLKDTAMSRIGRVLLNISELRRVPVDPSEVYFLEAVGEVLSSWRIAPQYRGARGCAVNHIVGSNRP